MTKYEYGKCNELAAERPGNGSTIKYDYDRAGRMTRISSESRSVKQKWDVCGRLVEIVDFNGHKESYLYTADGIRTKKVVGGKKATYIFDDKNIIAEISDDGATSATWTHTTGSWGGLLSERRNGESYTFSFDPSSNTRFLSDRAGEIAATFYLDAFGVDRATSGTPHSTPYRFGGGYGYWHDGANRFYVRACVFRRNPIKDSVSFRSPNPF